MAARAARESAIQAGAAPVLAGARLLTAPDLDALTGHLADSLAADGVTGHFCVRADAGEDRPLFGDAPELFAARGAADALRITGVLGGPARLDLLLRRPSEPLSRAAAARVEGYAQLYLARAVLLHEKAGDVPSGCPLSIRERLVLGRALIGEPLVRTAEFLKIRPETARSHMADAIAALGAPDRLSAIALAARRGWLLISEPSIPASNSGKFQ